MSSRQDPWEKAAMSLSFSVTSSSYEIEPERVRANARFDILHSPIAPLALIGTDTIHSSLLALGVPNDSRDRNNRYI